MPADLKKPNKIRQTQTIENIFKERSRASETTRRSRSWKPEADNVVDEAVAQLSNRLELCGQDECIFN